MEHDRAAEDRSRLLSNAAVAVLTGFSAGTLLDQSNLRAALRSSEHLRYTELQVQIVFAAGLFGLGFGLPAALLQKRIKPYYVTVIGCLGATVSVLFLWACTVSQGWYAGHVLLLAMFNFLTGHSIGYVYFTSLWVGFSASPSLSALVSLLHHLPLVCSALTLWMVQPFNNLFVSQFTSAAVSSLASIVLLRTPARIEEPVRVVGQARTFTLPAYEFPAADNESIAESGDSDQESARRPLTTEHVSRSQRFQRSLRDLRDAIPHIIAFAIALASSLPFAQETIVKPGVRLFLSAVGAILAAAVSASTTIPRTNLLFIILSSRAIFLSFAIPYHQLPGMDVLLYATGGLVEGAFWTTIPLLLFELHSYKRFTLLWSSAILGFGVACALHATLELGLLSPNSPLSLCTDGRCLLLLTELQLALTVIAFIALLPLHSVEKRRIDNSEPPQ